ncbi:MAG: copper resistance protein NlpE N-terminal domain-containing protein, partial [Ginsengibacter sp.]
MSRLLTIFLILVFSSCINTQSNSGYKPASEALNKQLVSTWKGILPCADCKEIQYALTIIPDGIFEEIEEHVGKFEHELLESGIWVLSADSVLKLTINNSDKIFFYDGKDLIARDENGKEMYRLKKSEPTETASYLNHQMFDGIDFLASGNEPFWSLKIKFDSSIYFKTMDGTELITPAPKEEASLDPNITRYYAESAEGSLTIQLYRQICINSMSGARNDYKIEVQVKMNGDIQNKTFEGCG